MENLWKPVKEWESGVKILLKEDHPDPWMVVLRSQEENERKLHFGFGKTPREAYRVACHAQRLAAHDVEQLLRERVGLRRMLRDAERKIAADSVQTLNLHNKIEQLHARIGALENDIVKKNQRIAALEAGLQAKPPRDPGTAVLTLEYVRRWLDRALPGEIQRDGLEVLLSLAQPWYARGNVWEEIVSKETRE